MRQTKPIYLTYKYNKVGKNNIVYYFAYGSNLSIDQMWNRVGIVKNYEPYILKGYSLCFDTGHFSRTFANIKKNENSFVEGVIYELTLLQLKELSFYEGCYNKHYFLVDGKEVIVFIGDEQYRVEKTLPEASYLRKIINGCKYHKFKKTENLLNGYLKKIEEAVSFINDNFLKND